MPVVWVASKFLAISLLFIAIPTSFLNFYLFIMHLHVHLKLLYTHLKNESSKCAYRGNYDLGNILETCHMQANKTQHY